MTIEAVKNEALQKFGEQVVAIYLTGSTLNNLQGKDSDTDVYVLLKQSKQSLVMENLRSGESHGLNDFKYMEVYKFVQLIYKTNPNVLEMLFKYPLYVTEEFKPIADFLFQNCNEIVGLNKSRYYSSAYGMTKVNYTKLKNGTGRVGQGKAGKEAVNFYKAYKQATYAYKGMDLLPVVVYEGKLREEMLYIKQKGSYSPEELTIELDKMATCLEELNKYKEEFAETGVNEELFSELLELL